MSGEWWAVLGVLVALVATLVTILIHYAHKSHVASAVLRVVLVFVVLGTVALAWSLVTGQLDVDAPPEVIRPTPPLNQPLEVVPGARHDRPVSNANATIEFVNRSTFNAALPAISVADGTGPHERITSALASALRGNDALFKPVFLTSGRFARARAGDASALSDLELSKAASMIVLGSRSVVIASEQVAGQTIVKASAELSFRVYYPTRGFSSRSFVEQATGVGFTSPEAERVADTELVKTVAARIQALE